MEKENKDKLEDGLFSKVIDRLKANIYITDIETDEIVYMNEAMKQTFQLEHPEGKTCWKVLQKNMDGRCPFCTIRKLEKLDLGSVCIWNEENMVTGRTYKNYDSLMEWGGRIYHIQDSTDVTEYNQLSEHARIDELTKMLNRRAGKEKLVLSMESAREEQKVLSVALYDINELKRINDTYGHREGDRLLRFVTGVARQYMGDRDFIFRLSGDEFVIVFYGRDHNEADEQMRQILQRMHEEKKKLSMYYKPSFSYGIMEVYPGDSYTVPDVISRADAQMYIQKRSFHIMQAKIKLKLSGGTRAVKENFVYDKEHLYDALAASTDDYIFVGNMQTGVFRYPPEMVEEFGLPGEVVENAAAFWGDLIHSQDEKYFLESNQEIADGRADYHNIEYRAKNVRGEWIWLRCRGKMIPNDQGVPGLFAGMITNLGKRNQIDHMTGLYNRFEFEGAIKKYLADKEQVSHVGVLLLNMDAFKNINDLYNRSFGDQILRTTAQRISGILPPDTNVYRLDGDEFGVVILNGDKEDCEEIFKRIQHIFGKQQEYNGKKYYCTLSGGYAQYPDDADTFLDLVKYATYSVEHSKLLGKNRMTRFTREILLEKEKRLELTELLRESIDRGFAGFSIHYQPQVDSESRFLYGAEALARWKCEKYGEIPPLQFIPLLEQSGLIIQFGSWIFRQAAVQCKKWCKKHPDFRMSVNFSYLQLMEPDIVKFMQDTLAELGLSPVHVTMELTETYLAKEYGELTEVIKAMQQTGMKIAMDDFGVGYSSLVSLKNTPADMVKIDRGFVRGIQEDRFNATFIRSITELCHNVGKTVCLEGVETSEEYTVAKEMGVDLIQGYHFGRPVCASVFEETYLNEK